MATVLYGGYDVVISSFRSWVQSVANSLVPVEFVIVDNSVGEGIEESLSRIISESAVTQPVSLNYLMNNENTGFAAGANKAVANATNEWVMLLNPDVTLYKEFITEVNDLELHNNTIYSLVLKTGDHKNLGIALTKYGFFKDRVSQDRQRLVGASGGGMLIRQADFLKVGGFPEDFFAWGEDADFAVSALGYGINVKDLATQPLDHVGGHSVSSIDGQRFKAFLLARNRVWFFKRNFNASLKILLALPYFFALLLNGMGKIRAGVGRSYYSGIIAGLFKNTLRKNNGAEKLRAGQFLSLVSQTKR